MELLTNIKIYKDGNDTILVFKNASDNLNNVINAVVNTIAECPQETAVSHLEPLPEEHDELPKFLSEPDNEATVEVVADSETNVHTEEVNIEDTPAQEPDIGKTVLNIGKMKGKTIEYAYNSDKNWMQWIINTYIPHTKEQKEQVDKIRKYLELHP